MPRMLDLIREDHKEENRARREQARRITSLAGQFRRNEFWAKHAEPFIAAYIKDCEDRVNGSAISGPQEQFLKGAGASLRDFLAFVRESERMYEAVLDREREDDKERELSRVTASRRF